MWKYPDEVIKFASENVKGKRPYELAKLLTDEFKIEFTPSKTRALMKNHGLKNGLPTRMKGENSIYPDEVRDYIKRNYMGNGHQDMANLVNEKFGTSYTKEQIKGHYARNKFDSGLTGQFTKGQVSWNKGKPKSWVGGEETRFKKGQIPVNFRPIGSERVNVDGYAEVKVSNPDKWKAKHIIIWEKRNGPIPEGYILNFGDRDKNNVSLENLLLVTKAQHAILNRQGLRQNDVELTKTAIIIADMKIKMSEIKKG